jgi:hypothetical protein
MTAVIVSVLLNTAAFVVLYAILSRRVRRELDARAVLDAIRDEVNGLVVELNQTTDRNIGLAEERMRSLKTLIDTADRKIQLASREFEKHQIGVEVYNKLKSSSLRRAQSGVENPKADQTHRGDENATPGTAPRGDEPQEADERPLADRVAELSRQGFDSRIIASRLGTTVGEVELILSLRGGRHDS